MKISTFSLPRSLKQWLMMGVDGLLVLAALWLSVILVSPDFFSQNSSENYFFYFLFSAFCSVVIFHRSGLYRTIVLYMGVQSGLVIFKGITLLTIITTIAVYFTDSLKFPGRAIWVFWMISLLFVGGIRF